MTSSNNGSARRRTRVVSATTDTMLPDSVAEVLPSPAVLPGSSDIDGWQRQVYKTAEEHGWITPDSQRSVGEDLVLMHDEISELYEQWNNHAPVLVYQTAGSKLSPCTKPEGLSMEVADLAIRLLALAHTERVSWTDMLPQARQQLSSSDPVSVPSVALWHLWVSGLCRWWRANNELAETVGSQTHTPQWLMALLWADMERHLAAWNGPTLLDAVRIKDEYNQTRPWRHGGKRI